MRRRTSWLLLASAITVVGCGPSLTAPNGLTTAYVPTSGLDAYNKSSATSLMPTGMQPSHGGSWNGGGGRLDDWKGGGWKGGDWKGGGWKGGKDHFFPPNYDPFIPPIFDPFFFDPFIPYVPPAITFAYGLPYPAYQWAVYPGPILPPVGGVGLPLGGIGAPLGGIGAPIGGIGAPIGGIGTPIGGVGTPIGGIGSPIGGVGTPIGQQWPGGQPMPADSNGGIGSTPIPGWPGNGSGQVQQSITNEFAQMDTNNDQWLSQKEYINGKMAQIRWVQQPSQQQMAQMQQQFLMDFQKSDADRNGYISLQEFANAPILTIQQGG